MNKLLPRDWTNAEISYAIREWYSEHGELPKLKDWEGGGDTYPAPITVRRHFGSWRAAIEATGLTPRKRGRPTKIELHSHDTQDNGN